MRFLADENVSRLVVERLRATGFDVSSFRETTPGAPDKDILDAADSDDRVLITEDRNFGEFVVRQRLKVCGVILLELDRLPSAAEAGLVAEIVRIHGGRAYRQSAGGRACAGSRAPPAAVNLAGACGIAAPSSRSLIDPDGTESTELACGGKR
jgi:predicted nuclease of predicted toxin-antitoxin system